MIDEVGVLQRSVIWRKALELDELSEGCVRPGTCGRHRVYMTHREGAYDALDSACPRQGGPLGEGSIEKGWFRCFWHGWGFHPATGSSPGGLSHRSHDRSGNRIAG